MYCVSFWFWWEIGSFFVVAGNFHYDRKKKEIQSSVWRVRDHYYDRKKKVSVWRVRDYYYDRKKKDTVVCLLGVRLWRLRPEKKDTVICLTDCAVVLFFVVAGNFDYDRKKKDSVVYLAGAQSLLRPEKKIQSSVTCWDHNICIILL